MPSVRGALRNERRMFETRALSTEWDEDAVEERSRRSAVVKCSFIITAIFR